MERLPTREINSYRDIIQSLNRLCRPHGEVVDINLFCRREHPHDVFCMVKVGSGALAAAHATGGTLFGSTLCLFQHLSPGFRCSGRPEGKLLVRFCNVCQNHARPSPQMDAAKH